jgi:hypothetical protein
MDGGAAGDDDEDVGDLRPWEMPHELFAFLRIVLSIWFGISTFSYQPTLSTSQDPVAASYSSSTTDAERFPFHQADRQSRRFVLGTELWNKMRRSYSKRRDRMQAQNVRRRLERAERLFERRGRRMRYRDSGDGDRAGGMMRSISALSLMCLLSNNEEDDDAVESDDVDRDVTASDKKEEEDERRNKAARIMEEEYYIPSDDDIDVAYDNAESDRDDDMLPDVDDDRRMMGTFGSRRRTLRRGASRRSSGGGALRREPDGEIQRERELHRRRRRSFSLLTAGAGSGGNLIFATNAEVGPFAGASVPRMYRRAFASIFP